MSSPPVFGKRSATRPASAPVASVTRPDHAAFFAAVRDEFAEAPETRGVIVPRSFKAAFLAGLVVGCALTGFDVTGSQGAARLDMVEGMMGLRIDTSGLLPVLILIGLFNGARIAAITVIGVHSLLAALGQTSYAAYAIGGAAAAACLALVLLTLGHAPTHGWPIDALTGAGAGFFYRMLAGARPA